jgi:trans-aconitate methyltransferase
VQDLLVFPDRERVRPASTTDWSAYYERPAALAPLTRRITARKLIATVDRVARGATLRHIVELGGGNSAFLRRFCERHPGAHVTAVDNNAAGLQLLARAFDGDPRLTTMEQDVLEPGAALKADLVFSTGLIEHFDRAGTSRAIAAHFEQARPGGLVIITYPTPTWLYRLVRGAAERLGVWSFPDERPLHDEEVVREAARHGDVLEVRTNWAIGLTQGILVARRRLQI